MAYVGRPAYTFLMRLLRLVLIPTLVLMLPAPTVAQVMDHEVADRWTEANWLEELGVSAVNAVLGGVVGGITAVLTDEASFAEGFVDGGVGGVVSYGGKRLSAERFFGAGAMGRALASVGGAMVQDPGGGVLPRRFSVPFGPARLHVDRPQGISRVKADLTATYWLVYGLAHPSLRFDAGRSVSAGAPVFVTDGADLDDALGTMAGGVIFADAESSFEDTFAHERVHVAQWDQLYASGGVAVERWVAERLGLDRWLEYVDVGLSPGIPMGGAYLAFDLSANPFEVEADYLESRSAARPELRIVY